jgi:hypothetical protein
MSATSFVCAFRSSDSRVVQLANYPSPLTEDERTIRIWEAARATAASPGYFDPISIGHSNVQLLDGGLGANNPVREVLQAARELWPDKPVGEQVGCLISIGTGMKSIQPLSDSIIHFAQAFVNLTLDTEATAESFLKENKNMFLDNRYFRFNVSRGLESVALDEINQWAFIASATDTYINTVVSNQQLRYAADRLARPQPKSLPLTLEENGQPSHETPEIPSSVQRSQSADTRRHPSRQRTQSWPSPITSKDEKANRVEQSPLDKTLQEIIANLAICLAQDPVIRPLSVAGLERVGYERFEMNLARLLQSSVQDLRLKSSEGWTACVARVVSFSDSAIAENHRPWVALLLSFKRSQPDIVLVIRLVVLSEASSLFV